MAFYAEECSNLAHTSLRVYMIETKLLGPAEWALAVDQAFLYPAC